MVAQKRYHNKKFIQLCQKTYSSLIHLFRSSGRELSRSDWSVIKSEWRADICWTMPGADTYVDSAAWVSGKKVKVKKKKGQWVVCKFVIIWTNQNDLISESLLE